MTVVVLVALVQKALKLHKVASIMGKLGGVPYKFPSG